MGANDMKTKTPRLKKWKHPKEPPAWKPLPLAWTIQAEADRLELPQHAGWRNTVAYCVYHGTDLVARFAEKKHAELFVWAVKGPAS